MQDISATSWSDTNVYGALPISSTNEDIRIS